MKLLTLVFSLVVLLVANGGVRATQTSRATKSACSIPSDYLNGLDWTGILKQCKRVGSGKSTRKCDKCFAAFVGAQTSDVIKYINVLDAIQDPAGTLASTVSTCSPIVTELMESKLSKKKDKKKIKGVKKCLKIDVDEMEQTQMAVQALILQKVLG